MPMMACSESATSMAAFFPWTLDSRQSIFGAPRHGKKGAKCGKHNRV